ncbi:hypothetical protein ABZY44_16640 [Streptomyces sp. NPDC006544]|uniref:hypothetical protein n=1 Tax=Streptomyces sp. NPDC006544 TaxID=3154583 RepID=UPI0033B3010E
MTPDAPRGAVRAAGRSKLFWTGIVLMVLGFSALCALTLVTVSAQAPPGEVTVVSTVTAPPPDAPAASEEASPSLSAHPTRSGGADAAPTARPPRPTGVPPAGVVTETRTVTVGPTVTVTEKMIERVTTTAQEGGGGKVEWALAGAALLTALSGATSTAAGVRKDRRRAQPRRR